jgi:hypothetical protein
MFPLLLMLLQPQLRATRPSYFLFVVVALLIAGGVGWLIAAVLGFARSSAWPSARWFTYAAVCLIIYHLHFLLFGVFVLLGMNPDGAADLSMALQVGAFFNLFVVVGAVCAIMGFVRMTSPR